MEELSDDTSNEASSNDHVIYGKCSTYMLHKLQRNIYIFFIWVFFHEHLRIARLQGKGEGISLTPNYHFHPLYRHLNIASSWTRTGNL